MEAITTIAELNANIMNVDNMKAMRSWQKGL